MPSSRNEPRETSGAAASSGMEGGLPQRLARSFERHAGGVALRVGDRSVRYGDLAETVLAWAGQLPSDEPSPFMAVLGYRSVEVYQAVLSVLFAGRGYVPLHPEFPVARSAEMVRRSKTTVLWVCPEAYRLVVPLLERIDRPLRVVGTFDDSTRRTWQSNLPRHTFIPLVDRSAEALASPRRSSVEAPAYLLFTSGSTGAPKGVAVSHANVGAYLDAVLERYRFTPQDRMSQTFDLTFDLSVHDMFTTWCCGATLYVLPKAAVMAPASFIRRHELTVWFSVPSVAMFMQRLRSLKPGALRSLRWSFFCGEALPQSLAEVWQSAAPESTIENLYGPTEATIAFTTYRWDPAVSPGHCRRGLVPIGTPLPGQRVRIVPTDVSVASEPAGADHVDEESGDRTGELWLAGTQVTGGYLDDAECSAERYIDDPTVPGGRWYRTGDLVCADASGCLHFVGRIDSQVQVLGHRVELSEIEWVLRDAAETEWVVAAAWPIENGTAQGIHAWIGGRPGDEALRDRVMEACRGKLPDYMVPRKIDIVPSFPLNANGKIDRRALLQQLGERRHDAA